MGLLLECSSTLWCTHSLPYEVFDPCNIISTLLDNQPLETEFSVRIHLEEWSFLVASWNRPSISHRSLFLHYWPFVSPANFQTFCWASQVLLFLIQFFRAKHCPRNSYHRLLSLLSSVCSSFASSSSFALRFCFSLTAIDSSVTCISITAQCLVFAMIQASQLWILDCSNTFQSFVWRNLVLLGCLTPSIA